MSKSFIHPVFYDPDNRRWRRFKLLFLILSLAIGLIFGVLTISILIDPVLPNLPLSPVHSHSHPKEGHTLSVHHQPLGAQVQVATVPEVDPYLVKADTTPYPRTEVIGFYVNWDHNSFTSLKQNIGKLDKLMPEWLHLAQSDGTITVNDPLKQEQTLDYIRQEGPDLAIVPLINNFNSQSLSWDGDLLAQMLGDPRARKRLIQNLLEFIDSNHFAGIHIDFENVPLSSQPQLVTFMGELYGHFHPLGLEVSQSLPPDDPSFDLRALSKYNDYLLLMAYDEYASSSNPGPVASQNWYIDNLRRCLQEVPADKLVIGVGSYGYDWKGNETGAKVISFQEVLKLTRDFQTPIAIDPTTLNPTFEYDDGEGELHRVWFLDAVTAFNQLVAI
jgi:spore germination protein YaaH